MAKDEYIERRQSLERGIQRILQKFMSFIKSKNIGSLQMKSLMIESDTQYITETQNQSFGSNSTERRDKRRQPENIQNQLPGKRKSIRQRIVNMKGFILEIKGIRWEIYLMLIEFQALPKGHNHAERNYITETPSDVLCKIFQNYANLEQILILNKLGVIL